MPWLPRSHNPALISAPPLAPLPIAQSRIATRGRTRRPLRTNVEVILPNILAQHIRERPVCPTFRAAAKSVVSPFQVLKTPREVAGEPAHGRPIA